MTLPSSGGRDRRGRRDNGLTASSFVPLADVDPRLGDYLLDVLSAAGVPAYLEPASDIEPTQVVRVPSPPTDRLWVDRDRSADARTIIAAETLDASSDQFAGRGSQEPAAPLGGDEEQAWEDLIARFDEDAAHVWPAAEDLDTTTVAPPAEAVEPEPEPEPESERSDRLEDKVSEAEEHYVPPPPPPFPRLSVPALFALALIVLGGILIIVPRVLSMGGEQPFVLGVLSVIAGGGLLVWRLKADRYDDDGDDGAVV